MMQIAIGQFKQWTKNSKQFIWLILIVFIYQFISGPLIVNAKIMGCSLGCLEPYIALSSHCLLQLILPLSFLILISDFPEKYGTSYYSIIRTGREKWLYSQMVFLMLSSGFFIVMVYLITILTSIGHLSYLTDWSPVITDFAEQFPELSGNYGASLLDESTYFQGKPWEVTLYSVFLMWCHLYLIGMIQIGCFSLGMKKAGYVGCIIIEAIGFVLSETESFLKWFFPSAHSVFSLHHTKYYSEEIFSLDYSVLYFVGLIMLVFIVSQIGIKQVALTKEG